MGALATLFHTRGNFPSFKMFLFSNGLILVILWIGWSVKDIKCVFSHGLVGCADTCESPPNSIVLMEERGERGIPSI